MLAINGPLEIGWKERDEIVLPINRSRSRALRRLDHAGCSLPEGETMGCSNDRPLNTSMRLACRLIAATKPSIEASAPRITSSSTGM